jgi:putative DNA-invertase from lambdoid prophage Rac
MIYAYIGGFESLSDFEHQKAVIREFAEDHQMDIDEWWVEIIDFRGVKGRKLNELSRVMSAGDLLLVEGVSRLGHSLQAVLSLLRLLMARDITLQTVSEELVFSDPALAEAYALALQVDRHLLRELRHLLPRKRPKRRRNCRSVLDGREAVVRALLKRDLPRTAIAKILDVSPATVSYYIRTRQKQIGLHYLHIEKTIRAFFREQGLKIEVEPSGSSGPDLAFRGSNAVGEIKHREEIQRDLRGYFQQWNSDLTFGGKSTDYRLSDELTPDATALGREVQGWLAVIYGQLRFYCRRAECNTGWLVLEDVEADDRDLVVALQFLEAHGRITVPSVDRLQNVLFVRLSFPELQPHPQP